MTLAALLAHLVDWRVRERGREYFQAGRVRLTECGPEVARAEVTGTETYPVSLTREEDTVWAVCSCPFFAGGAICKHIWATILAADERKGLRGPYGDVPRKLRLPSEAKERPHGGPPPAPTWRDRLHELAGRPPLTPAPSATLDGREILYLLDVPTTLKSSRLTLRVMTGRRTPEGPWQAVAPINLTRDAVQRLPEPDRTFLSLLILAAAETSGTRGYSGYSYQVPTVCPVPPVAAEVLIPQLGATDRFWTRPGKEIRMGAPITWDAGPPWEVWLEIREEPGVVRLAAALRRGDERLGGGVPPVVLGESGFLLAGDRLARLAEGGSRWAALLDPEKALRVPAAERDELIGSLLAANPLPPLDLPEPMRYEEARLAPRPFLRLLPPRWLRNPPRAELSFLYEGREVAPSSPQRGLYQPAERRFLLRDREAEARSDARLRELGFRPDPDPYASGPPGLQIAANRIPGAVSTLLAEGWAVEAEGKLYRSPGRFKMSVSSGVDWFDLDGEADFEGQSVPLPKILEAIRRGARFITLDDGTLGMLPEEWTRTFAPIVRLGTAEGESVRFRSVQAALLDAWLTDESAELASISCDEAFERARERLGGFAGIVPAAAPPGFRGELRGYQRTGLGWLHFLREFGFGGCLADDMGLGKTVQVLALLEARRAARKKEGLPPSLVVVPRSLVFNWIAEAAQFTPRLRMLDYTGSDRADRPFTDCDVVLTTYGTLRKDVAALRAVEFDYLILDEAQAIKNADSQTAKAARLLRGRHRLALTGTPVENHLGELWSLLEFLNPGFLGASPAFRQLGDDLRDPESRGLLARALRPLILRRTKEAVAPELPPKLEQTIYCVLPARQRKLYDELRDHYRQSLGARIGEQGMGRSKILVLEALLRLRQAACHPGLLDPKRVAEPCAKLDLLLPQLREILDEGHKVLVFSQFTSFLAILREQLDAAALPYLYLDGRTRDRQEKVETFQTDPGARLFLISLKAGGLGLNLTAADYVYLLDPWWNPAVESQAIDRAHRIGQVRPVFASRLVARDTVEEKILELQATKRDLADAVIQADKSLLAGLSREDLEMLLS
ncbi:MAG TPA: SNF2-related protein [Thermoanaerobaculia bacterium]|nr:SNF2-related protein [Thermoanaerobaculia bacterium]